MNLDDAFTEALRRGRTGAGPMSLEEAAGEFGRTRAEQNRAMAEYFGVNVRTVQRWRSTGAERRAPGAARLKRARLAAGRRAGIRRRGEARQRGAGVSVRGRVRVSGDTRDRSIGGLSVSGESMGEILDLMAEGDRDGAMDRLQEALGSENGFGDSVFLEELSELEIDIGEE